jgi:hypothetical protein
MRSILCGTRKIANAVRIYHDLEAVFEVKPNTRITKLLWKSVRRRVQGEKSI